MSISVITPSFGQLGWLKLCIASVADQAANGLHVEHIVQDAGSESLDAFCAEISRDLCARYGGIPVQPLAPGEALAVRCGNGYSLRIFREADGGMYDAINRGLAKASGEICAYLNCDEQYLEGALAYVGQFFEGAPATGVLFGAAIVVGPDGTYVCDRRVLVPRPAHTMVSGNLSIFTGSTFFRREAVVGRGLLFDPRWKMLGDAAWVLALLRAQVPMVSVHRPLSAFAETGQNLTAGPAAACERARMLSLAPLWARAGRPLILAFYRLERLLAGAYRIGPHRYSIYTAASPARRRAFDVPRPTFRWRPPVPR